MTTDNQQLADMHQILQLLQTVDVGLVLLDDNCNIHLWNSFMESHSGLHTSDVRDRNLFKLFPELPQSWLKSKIDSVFRLQIRSYSTWEQRPRLFNFKSARPLTGQSELMYQNISIIPLTNSKRQVTHVCMLVYDVTEAATNRLALETANDSLRKLSRTDRLTGLHNRGYWEECLEQEFLRCKRSHNISSLVMLDIDRFKLINDELGHQAGDKVLREISNVIRESVRETDIAGRYGGEEFTIILPDTGAGDAFKLSERLRMNIASTPIGWNGDILNVTVSLGVCELHAASMANHLAWSQCADEALYTAKQGGRNRSVIHAPSKKD